MARHVKSIVILLLLGLATTVAVAWAMAIFVNVSGGGSATAYAGDWEVSASWNTGALRVVSSRSLRSWAAQQAAGPPDTPNAGDFGTAWAPSTSAGNPDWLLLTYEKPIQVESVEIHETYRPGALTRVTLVADDGTETDVWSGTDPTPPTAPMGVSRIAINSGDRKLPEVRKIKLYQGRKDVPGWNEIDAVGAVDPQGTIHWALAADASSSYGQSTVPSSADPTALIPSWSGLSVPTSDYALRTVKNEARAVDARGWPMLALWTRVAGVPPPSGLTAYGGPLSSTWIPTGAATPGSPVNAVIPWRPIWGGLAVDTLIYAAIWALLGVVLLRPRRFFREVSRVKRGCCVVCGYDLGYDFRAGCPECGWRRASS